MPCSLLSLNSAIRHYYRGTCAAVFQQAQKTLNELPTLMLLEELAKSHDIKVGPGLAYILLASSMQPV
jgi:hypothetical protein